MKNTVHWHFCELDENMFFLESTTRKVIEFEIDGFINKLMTIHSTDKSQWRTQSMVQSNSLTIAKKQKESDTFCQNHHNYTTDNESYSIYH